MNNFTYFAQPLDSICEAGCFVPAFVDKCVEFVENSGGECEKNVIMYSDLFLFSLSRQLSLYVNSCTFFY